MTLAAVEASELTKDLSVSFLQKPIRAVEKLTLTIEKSETYGLLGPNGAGKTTTIKLLLGLLRPSSGKITVLGESPGSRNALKRIGYLPENPYFYSHLTGYEFLDFVGQLFGQTKDERKRKIEELLQLVVMPPVGNLPMRKYSKGMLQRLGIAQSLMNDPELIFWDEPMSGLDPIGRRDVRMILTKLKESGKTIFLNSHLLPDVNEICDRIGILYRGKLIAQDSIANISGGNISGKNLGTEGKTNYRALEDYFLKAVGEASKAG
jgi:ABC-2 type transport system ATP-binding protein